MLKFTRRVIGAKADVNLGLNGNQEVKTLFVLRLFFLNLIEHYLLHP